MRGGGCRHGSGVLWVRGSDCWAAAGGGGAVVADTVVAAISDAAGKAAPAVVAEHALPKPYVPGSGDRVPAELRLVLVGYVGIAGGLFATALACATAFAFSFSRLDGPAYGLLFSLAVGAFVGGAVAGAGGGAVAGVQGAYPVFQAAPAAQRSTHGHGDGLEAWRTHTDTRHHPPGRHRSRVPVAVRGSPRAVAEGRHAGAR